MRVDAAGVLIQVADAARTVALAVDRFRNIYSCDFYQVFKTDPQGTKTVLAGTADRVGYTGDGGPAVNALLNYCSGLAVDNNGNVYISDRESNRVRRIDPAGIINTFAGGGTGSGGDGGPATRAYVYQPKGLALDGTGNLFIATGAVVRMVNSAGIINRVAGRDFNGFSGDGGPALQAALNGPDNISIDRAGNLYVADEWNYRVRRVDRATQIITTVAGNGQSGYSGDGGPATSAQMGTFGMPMAVDPGGRRFYIVEYIENRVRQVDNATGIITTFAGTGVAGQDSGGQAIASSLRTPNGLTFDRAGNMYITESQRGLVRRVDMAGQITVVAGDNDDTLAYPRHVAVDNSGNLYIVDGRPRVWKVSPTGVMTTLAGTGTHGFSGDGAGNVYISDTGNHRVRKVSTAGVITTVAGNGQTARCGDGGPATGACIGYTAGLAVDGSGALYIPDFHNNVVRKVSPTGIISTIAGNGTSGFSGDFGPATSAQMYFPWSVAVDRSGNVYIADSGNDRIRRVEPTGKIHTVAGNGAAGYSGDGGPAIDAALDQPRDLAVDAAGNLFIADENNHRVRRVIAPPPLPAAPVANDDAAELTRGRRWSPATC